MKDICFTVKFKSFYLKKIINNVTKFLCECYLSDAISQL